MSFTRKEALMYHREMWGKIRDECGNNATNSQRMKVKAEYLRSKGHACLNYCYLCEYAFEEEREKSMNTDCALCPIDWSNLADEDDPERGYCLALYKKGYDMIFKCAPIDEILALPEREVKGGKDNAELD